MAKYIDAEKIRAEIERRKKENMYYELPMTIGRYYEDRDLLSFLDTLEELDIELIQKSWYMEGYHDCEFGYEPKWIIKTGEGGPRYEENPKYGQHIEKQDYSGLNDFERAIHRGFLCAGVVNVPVNIIKETAQDCLAHLPVEWSDDFDKEVENVHKRYPEVSYAKLTRIAYHFSKWANRRKDIEWSEEDEYCWNLIWDILDGSFACSKEGYKKASAWFLKNCPKGTKSLRPVKQEWSEEDRRIADRIQMILEFYDRNYPGDGDIESEVPKYIYWLKSLRPSWKPSEEQPDNEDVDKVAQEQFNEQMNTRPDKWSHLDRRAVKAGIAFAARMCTTYPELAKVWYDSLPKVTMD